MSDTEERFDARMARVLKAGIDTDPATDETHHAVNAVGKLVDAAPGDEFARIIYLATAMSRIGAELISMGLSPSRVVNIMQNAAADTTGDPAFFGDWRGNA